MSRKKRKVKKSYFWGEKQHIPTIEEMYDGKFEIPLLPLVYRGGRKGKFHYISVEGSRFQSAICGAHVEKNASHGEIAGNNSDLDRLSICSNCSKQIEILSNKYSIRLINECESNLVY